MAIIKRTKTMQSVVKRIDFVGLLPESGVAEEIDPDGHEEERSGREEGLAQPQRQAGGGPHRSRRPVHRPSGEQQRRGSQRLLIANLSFPSPLVHVSLVRYEVLNSFHIISN